ncbi:MAG: NYN domain-containing protein [Candidatus Dojkabacteria bacterium]|jgi:uncharacterized LabA/DUF88 family protein|nr:NYN domain-containing protein [Candidatus Dojkabacteria bacterium]
MPISNKNLKDVVYAFLDSQNLNLGTLKNLYKGRKLIYKGWKLDFRKFRIYLKEKLGVDRAFLFIGFIEENKSLYNRLRGYGYELVFKKIIKGEKGELKGNIDADLVLKVLLEIDNYDKAIIVSGDGDFYSLYKYLIEENKLKGIVIPNNKSESSLLKDFQKYKIYLWRHRERLEKKWRA